jgi:hypothetical protein
MLGSQPFNPVPRNLPTGMSVRYLTYPFGDDFDLTCPCGDDFEIPTPWHEWFTAISAKISPALWLMRFSR